jgi:hypothetical protein
MKVRILMGFDAYEPGQVFEDWPGGMCELLIARGLIEEVKDKAPVVERSVDEPEVETAEASPKAGKKPRK